MSAIDLDNYEQFRGRSCDLLINANGNSKKFLAEQDPAKEFDASVTSVLRSLLDFPCKRYVYLSTIDVYPRVDDPRCNRETAPIDAEKVSRYGLHKYLAEQLVRKYADRWLICRLGGMVGTGLWKNSIFDILHDQPLRVSAASEYQFMNTDDVAKIVLDARPSAAGKRHVQRLRSGLHLAGPDRGTGGQAASTLRRGEPRVERYEVNVEKLQVGFRAQDGNHSAQVHPRNRWSSAFRRQNCRLKAELQPCAARPTATSRSPIAARRQVRPAWSACPIQNLRA